MCAEGERENEETVDHGGQQLLCLFQNCIIQLFGREERERERGGGGGEEEGEKGKKRGGC